MEKSELTQIGKSFTSRIAENYEKYMAPLFFISCAEDLAGRLSRSTGSLLEAACGTGQVTRLLRKKLPDAEITATDLNPGMIETARNLIDPADYIRLQIADAQALEFNDNTFDTVICQFGIMFFPDKQKAVNEAYRVLKPGGKYIFSTWKKFDKVSKLANDLIMQHFSENPPDFYYIPFSMQDPEEHNKLMAGAGFKNVKVYSSALKGNTKSPENAVKALTEGTPAYAAICQRDEKKLPVIQQSILDAIRKEFGSSSFTIDIEMWVAEGIK